jgi:hypothetical protein
MSSSPTDVFPKEGSETDETLYEWWATGYGGKPALYKVLE